MYFIVFGSECQNCFYIIHLEIPHEFKKKKFMIGISYYFAHHYKIQPLIKVEMKIRTLKYKKTWEKIELF